MDGGVEESFEKKRVDIRYRFFFLNMSKHRLF